MTNECHREIGAVDDVDVQKDAFSSTADSVNVEYRDHDARLYQQSCPEKYTDNCDSEFSTQNDCDAGLYQQSCPEKYTDNCDSEFSTRKRLDKKKKSTKLWRIVSSSDEEADTLKDRFWINLEEGVLPEELGGADLYSSVCGIHLITCVWCTALFQGSCATLNSAEKFKSLKSFELFLKMSRKS